MIIKPSNKSNNKNHKASLKSISWIKNPPKKKPIPFIEFLEPVNQDTNLNRFPLESVSEETLIADLDAVLVRSLAIPQIPWKTIIHIKDKNKFQKLSTNDNDKIPIIWREKPKSIILLIPNFEVSHPPVRLEKIPTNSYRRNSKASIKGEYPRWKKCKRTIILNAPSVRVNNQ